MRRKPVIAKSLLTALILSIVIVGCSPTCRATRNYPGLIIRWRKALRLPRFPPAMKIAQEVPRFWVDVTLRNLTEGSKKARVIVQVDNEQEVVVVAKNPIAPKKKDTISVITLGRGLPRTVSLAVINE